MLNLEELDDMSFSDLMKKSITEISVLCPEWTDFNAHDPGITFLEMLMWLVEMQRYYTAQITENHLNSYLKLIDTVPHTAIANVVAVKLYPDNNRIINIKKDYVLKIGDVPYRLISDVIVPADEPEMSCDVKGKWYRSDQFETNSDNSYFYIKQNLMPFRGKVLPLYFSLMSTEKEPLVNISSGFYTQAVVKIYIETDNGWEECIIKDETYGFTQSGFINISIPDNINEEKSILKIVIFSDDIFYMPSIEFVSNHICVLVQENENNETMGASGKVKENLVFWINIDGYEIKAVTYKELYCGCNDESPYDAFERYRSEQLRLSRAVNKDDYIRIAMETPGLKIDTINVFSNEPGKVSVCVKPCEGKFCKHTVKNLRKVLFEAKPIGTEIEILTPILFHARLFVGAEVEGWASSGKLVRHIKKSVKFLEENMGITYKLSELFMSIKALNMVSDIKWLILRFDNGNELTQEDILILPNDGLMILDDIIIQ